MKASVCLETVSMETKDSFLYRLDIQGATVQSVRDFIPNFRPPSHEMDYSGPHRYKLSVTMTTQKRCLRGTWRRNPACCCIRAK